MGEDGGTRPEEMTEINKSQIKNKILVFDLQWYIAITSQPYWSTDNNTLTTSTPTVMYRWSYHTITKSS